MFCPSCGAPNDERDQRYCRECGTSLPTAGANAQPVSRRGGDQRMPVIAAAPAGGSYLPLPIGGKHRLAVGAGAIVALVVVAYLVIQWVLGILSALLPLLALVVAGAIAFLYLRRARGR